MNRTSIHITLCFFPCQSQSVTTWWMHDSACVALSQDFRTVVSWTLPLRYNTLVSFIVISEVLLPSSIDMVVPWFTSLKIWWIKGRRPNHSESSSFKVILIDITLGLVNPCNIVWWLAVQPVSLQGFGLLSKQAERSCLWSVHCTCFVVHYHCGSGFDGCISIFRTGSKEGWSTLSPLELPLRDW